MATTKVASRVPQKNIFLSFEKKNPQKLSNVDVKHVRPEVTVEDLEEMGFTTEEIEEHGQLIFTITKRMFNEQDEEDELNYEEISEDDPFIRPRDSFFEHFESQSIHSYSLKGLIGKHLTNPDWSLHPAFTYRRQVVVMMILASQKDVLSYLHGFPVELIRLIYSFLPRPQPAVEAFAPGRIYNLTWERIKAVPSYRHSSFISYIDSYVSTDNRLWILCESLGRGSLSIFCEESVLTELEMSWVASQMLSAIQYLVRHPEFLNLLGTKSIDEDQFWISAEGEIKFVPIALEVYRRFLVLSQAPEVYSDVGPQSVSSLAVWRFGLIMLALMEELPPFMEVHPSKAVLLLHLHGWKEGVATKWSPELRDFISLCFEVDPQKRATVEQLLGHAFLSGAQAGRKEFAARVERDMPLSSRIYKQCSLAH